MIKSVQAFNAISDSVIDDCINDYNQRLNYQTDDMKKCNPGDSLHRLIPYCKLLAGNDIEFCSGNFYKHSSPYLPHTDFRVDQQNEINFVIPLEFVGTKPPHLIVFDQRWEEDSVTWCMHRDLLYFEINTGIKGCPAEYRNVKNLTNSPISYELYNYLDMYPKHLLFGLSGTAFPFTPGSIIMFDNKKIHCTSMFVGEKLGISLRFKRV